jgi:phosphate:Na+ symporter
MIEPFKMGYTAIGGLGVFILGMKYLSDSLQSLSGDLIRKAISSVTTNRILAVIVGLFVTTFVQSSSITTVMVVGLVNAGLMELTQAIGVILGANIGTTITGWILAVKVGKYGLLLIAIGVFPMLFSKNDRVSATAKVFVALGMIFFGLQIMSGAFKPLRTDARCPIVAQHSGLRRDRLRHDHDHPEQFGDARHHHRPGNDRCDPALHCRGPGHG